jgi:hypothetical protein
MSHYFYGVLILYGKVILLGLGSQERKKRCRGVCCKPMCLLLLGVLWEEERRAVQYK